MVNQPPNASTSIPGGNYTWTSAGSTLGSQNSLTVNPLSTTFYELVYTVNGCKDSVNILVDVIPLTPVDVIDQSICEGDTLTLTAIPQTTGGSYIWTSAGVNIGNQQSIDVNPSLSTDYIVEYIINGYSDFDTTLVTVNMIPSVQINDVDICQGDSANLIAIPDVPGGTYEWNPGGPGPSSIYVSPQSTNSFSVYYTLNGCNSPEDTAWVNVTNTPVITSTDTIICQGQTAILNTSVSQIGGSYLWLPGNQTTPSISVSPNVDSNYIVIYQLNGCPSLPDTSNVIVSPSPNVTFTVSDTIGCSPLPVVFTNTTQDATNCIWDLGVDGTFNNCGTFSYTFQNPGCYTISLTTDSPNGCSSSSTFTNLICVNPTPVADFGVSSNTISASNPMVNIYNNSIDADQCTWYFGDGTMSVDYHPGSHTYPYDIGSSYVLTLVAQSDSGCVDSMMQEIAFYDDLLYYVPNSFIPDGDNVNDVWLPVFSSGIDENQYQLYVFNRWGNVVF